MFACNLKLHSYSMDCRASNVTFKSSNPPIQIRQWSKHNTKQELLITASYGGPSEIPFKPMIYPPL